MMRVPIEPRTEQQRIRIWATIDEVVGAHITINGTAYNKYQWEQIFTGLVRHQQMVENPNEKGSLIVLSCREKELTKDEASIMISLMEVFCAENGVKLHDRR